MDVRSELRLAESTPLISNLRRTVENLCRPPYSISGQTASVPDLRPKLWQPLPIPHEQFHEMARLPISRTVALWIGQAAEQPTQVEAVGPDRNTHLVAAKECDGGPNAVNRHGETQIPF